MTELRWVLLGLGILVVAGVYIWGRATVRRRRRSAGSGSRRTEPHISGDLGFDEIVTARDDDGDYDVVSPEDEAESDQGASGAAARAAMPEKVVTIRFIPKSGELRGEETVLAMRQAGLEHGRFGIFHRHDATDDRIEQFSVASLTEPGSFDLTQLAHEPIAGLSFFMVLPGAGDPVTRFDAMVEAARSLALELDAELFDDRGSSWSIQRERYVREEIIRYRHELMQTEVVGHART